MNSFVQSSAHEPGSLTREPPNTTRNYVIQDESLGIFLEEV